MRGSICTAATVGAESGFWLLPSDLSFLDVFRVPVTLVSELHLSCLEGSNRKLPFDLAPSLSNLISSI